MVMVLMDFIRFKAIRLRKISPASTILLNLNSLTMDQIDPHTPQDMREVNDLYKKNTLNLIESDSIKTKYKCTACSTSKKDFTFDASKISEHMNSKNHQFSLRVYQNDGKGFQCYIDNCQTIRRTSKGISHWRALIDHLSKYHKISSNQVDPSDNQSQTSSVFFLQGVFILHSQRSIPLSHSNHVLDDANIPKA